jgi:hypothetical protein
MAVGVNEGTPSRASAGEKQGARVVRALLVAGGACVFSVARFFFV